MLEVRVALILIGSAMIGAITVGLCLADGTSWPSALLSGGAAAGAAVGVLALAIG